MSLHTRVLPQMLLLLGTTRMLQQLYLLTFAADKIRIDPEALSECSSMHERSLKLKDSEWFTPNFIGFRITTLNIRSLRKHFTDLTVDQTIMNSDFICITETHIQTNEESDLQLPNYNAFFQSEGKGKGCVIYTHHSLGLPYNLRSVGPNTKLQSLHFLTFK